MSNLDAGNIGHEIELADEFLARAYNYRQLKNYDTAIDEFNKVIELEGMTPEQVAATLVHRGYCYR